ncbi:MAG: cobyrinate a,c-diamide synthase, partial [Firmicutes bacterium]|nr:cobyrinate a,c-diamide synthase [Bacillota bacterium]
MPGRILIAGTNSGCGKTTVSIALMKALKERGLDICAFKCGPDYIDPMFHRAVLGIPSYNLDPFFCTPEQLRGVLSSHAREISVAEGVMGYYDGIGPQGDASTFTVAVATKTPVVLVVNVRGMYTSAGAIIKGFKDFKDGSGIKGVIFNGASPMTYPDLAKIAAEQGVKAYGFMPKVPEAEIGSRHLGLITAAEIEDLQERISALGRAAEEHLDIDGILELADTAPEISGAGPAQSVRKTGEGIPIAIARDEAFCFIYEENIECLKAAGFEPVWFSPLHDEKLPEGVRALYLPGGYPELYTKELSENDRMLHSVKNAISRGLPTFAECGGFMYLHEALDGVPMVGAVKGGCFKTPRLQRFGYVTLTAKEDSLFCQAGGSIRAHEFHYYDSDDSGSTFRAEKPSGKRGWDCVVGNRNLYAGYPHLYLPAAPEFAEDFAGRAL